MFAFEIPGCGDSVEKKGVKGGGGLARGGGGGWWRGIGKGQLEGGSGCLNISCEE